MSLTVLDVLKQVCGRVGVPKPASAVSNSDAMISQMVGLVNGLSEDLDTRATIFDGVAWVWDSNLSVYKRLLSRDDDTFPALPDSMPINYLLWKWKSVKGLEYAEDFAAYERLASRLTQKALNTEGVLDVAGQGNRAYQVRSLNQAPWLLQRN